MIADYTPAYKIKYHQDRLKFHLHDLPDVVESDPDMIQPTLNYIKHHKSEINKLKENYK